MQTKEEIEKLAREFYINIKGFSVTNSTIEAFIDGYNSANKSLLQSIKDGEDIIYHSDLTNKSLLEENEGLSKKIETFNNWFHSSQLENIEKLENLQSQLSDKDKEIDKLKSEISYIYDQLSKNYGK